MLSAPTMTARRQQANGPGFRTGSRPGIAAIALLASLFVLACLPLAARAATTERVVANRYTGVALEGFDPVAYFVEARPALGREDREASEAGVVWRFRNEGNRASFAAHPEVYAPRFGGFDPLAIGRGVATPGNPLIWFIFRQNLYLFHSAEN